MKFTKYQNNRGFTLIENLIAMSLISLIAMAFFTILNSTIKANSVNEKNIKCLNIAQSEVENIRQQIKESKPIHVESNEPIAIEINNNIYYEIIKVEETEITHGGSNGYLYTINVIVNYDKEALILGKGKEITTQVFSTQNL